MMDQHTETDLALSLGMGSKIETRKFFHQTSQTSQTFTSSSGTSSDRFSKFVKENEERFQLQCSSRSSVSGFQQNGAHFIRSISAGSGWTASPLQTEGNLLSPFSQTSPPAKLSSMDNTFGDKFSKFVVSNRQMWAASSGEKFSMSHSSCEYYTNMSR
jgi:hypothetical protein